MKGKGVPGRGHRVGKVLGAGGGGEWTFRVQKKAQRERGRGRPDSKSPLGTAQDTWQSLAKVIPAFGALHQQVGWAMKVIPISQMRKQRLLRVSTAEPRSWGLPEATALPHEHPYTECVETDEAGPSVAFPGERACVRGKAVQSRPRYEFPRAA